MLWLVTKMIREFEIKNIPRLRRIFGKSIDIVVRRGLYV